MANGDWGVEISGGFFDEKRHLYRNAKGTIVPSVTQIFDILGFTDFSAIAPEVLEWKRLFGTSVHSAIELLVQNDLDWDSCDERAIPAIAGIEQKLKQLQYVSHAYEEKRIYNLCGMEYGGSLDHRGLCTHQGIERHCIVDLKTAVKVEPTWKWQVSAYTVGLDKQEKPWLGIVLQVDREGAVTPHYVDTYAGLKEFQILLAAAIIKINCGAAKIGKA